MTKSDEWVDEVMELVDWFAQGRVNNQMLIEQGVNSQAIMDNMASIKRDWLAIREMLEEREKGRV